MKMNKLLLPVFILSGILATMPVRSQDKEYVQKVVKKLSSKQFHGRGYVKNGDRLAASFLAKEMEKAGLQNFSKDYFQFYSFPINTFPDRMEVEVDDRELKPGRDFVVHPSLHSQNKSFQLKFLADSTSKISSVYTQIDTNKLKDNEMIVLPDALKNAYRNGLPGVDAFAVRVSGKPWWHVSGGKKTSEKVILKVSDSLLKPGAQKLELEIENKYITEHQAVNLAGYVKGSVQPDTFFVFVAHYDHLGMMGKYAMFPGASDNASGTATVLDLGRYYASHPEKAYYTMIFLLVSGEEAGLLGSSWFAEHPYFALDKVKFVINLDMVGTGSEGLSVVNGEQYPKAAKLIQDLNQEHGYFPDVRLGGESCNSDHCPFYKKGVPSFFLFTRGAENQEYHTVTDTYDKLPFTAYPQLFAVLTTFVERVQTQADFRSWNSF